MLDAFARCEAGKVLVMALCRERLRRLAAVPGFAAVRFSRSQPSRATSRPGHRVCQFPLIPRRARYCTGRQKAQSQRCAG